MNAKRELEKRGQEAPTQGLHTAPISKSGKADFKKDQMQNRETDMSYYLYEIRQKQEQLRKKLTDDEAVSKNKLI